MTVVAAGREGIECLLEAALFSLTDRRPQGRDRPTGHCRQNIRKRLWSVLVRWMENHGVVESFLELVGFTVHT